MLQTLVPLLGAAVLLVPLSRRAGFGSVLAYLVAGALIGPSALRLVTNVEEIRTISELGVVMLLFLIGLELRPQRLWIMRRSVFGLGLGQVVASAVVLAAVIHLAGIPWTGAAVLGTGLAMSSTAIVLPMLAERDLLGSRAGRETFAVLLFQDMAFIPLVAVVPLLGGQTLPDRLPWQDVASGVAAIAVILLVGHFVIPRAFRAIGGARTPEVFTGLALLTVVGAAAIASAAGLSMSLGAFLGGVLLSSSEYRHELQADIEPFEGLLLGFFFMSVGMTIDPAVAIAAPATILGGLALLLGVKVAVAFALAKVGGADTVAALRFSLALPQGSEFSFVLFAAAVATGALAPEDADHATLVIALSMAATPILFSLSERLLVPRLIRREAPVYDTIEDTGTPVIICGFGRVGQIVGRILRLEGVAFTALEKDPAQVDVVRRFGNKVYFGNATRPDLLRAAGAEGARLLVVAIDDMESALQVVDIARRTFPNLKIIARARNRRHAHLLMDRAVTGVVRETFHSSLKLAELVLEALDVPNESACRAVALFAEHDTRNLATTHAFYEDERKLIQNAQQAAEELTALFEADRPDANPAPRAAAE